MSSTIIFILISLLSISIIINLVFGFISLKYLFRINNRLDDQGGMLYQLIKQQKSTDNDISILFKNAESIYTISDNTNKSLNSLSLGIKRLNDTYTEELNKEIYPTPQLSEMIGVTIKEQLMTEFIFVMNQRAPSTHILENIVDILIKTYPHVSREYLVRRTTMEIEKWNNSNK